MQNRPHRTARLFAEGFTSPRAIALGVLGVVALVAFASIDWIGVIDRVRAWLARLRGTPAPPSIRQQLGGATANGPTRGSSQSVQDDRTSSGQQRS